MPNASASPFGRRRPARGGGASRARPRSVASANVPTLVRLARFVGARGRRRKPDARARRHQGAGLLQIQPLSLRAEIRGPSSSRPVPLRGWTLLRRARSGTPPRVPGRDDGASSSVAAAPRRGGAPSRSRGVGSRGRGGQPRRPAARDGSAGGGRRALAARRPRRRREGARRARLARRRLILRVRHLLAPPRRRDRARGRHRRAPLRHLAVLLPPDDRPGGAPGRWCAASDAATRDEDVALASAAAARRGPPRRAAPVAPRRAPRARGGAEALRDAREADAGDFARAADARAR